MKLGQLLRKQNLITEAELQQALEIQKQDQRQRKLGEILVKLGYISEERLLSVVALQRGFPLLKLGYPLDPNIVSMIPKEICLAHCLIPIDRFGKHLLIATSDPLNKAARNQLEALHKGELKYRYVLATRDDILRAIERYYPRNIPAMELNGTPAPGNTLQAHIQRVAEAVQRFAELRKQFREQIPLAE